MDLESIALFLAKKNLGVIEIQAEMNNVLGAGTVAYSTVTRYLGKRSFTHPSERPPDESEIEGPDSIDTVISQALDETPFASLRQVSKRILIPMTTLQHHLVHRMHFKLKHCKWVPHKLSEAQKHIHHIHHTLRILHQATFSYSVM
jgi:hypothetical protein